jgi:inositol transport system substrate-binding protein
LEYLNLSDGGHIENTGVYELLRRRCKYIISVDGEADVIAAPGCRGINIIDEKSADWSRTKAQDLMTNWISRGMQFDAVVSNNDEMALGAIQAMKAAGIDTKKAIVGGVDATEEALVSMKAGELKVTVFQDPAGQAKGAIDAALKLAKGEKADKEIYIPFQLVTPATVDQFLKKN